MITDFNEVVQRRVNRRRFDIDKIPPKETIEQILKETIDIAPVKNEYYGFKLNIFGPEYAEEKKELALLTMTKRKWKWRNRGDQTEEEWYKFIEEKYDNEWKRPQRYQTFNHQVRAPWLVVMVENHQTWNPNGEQQCRQHTSYMAGVFGTMLSLVANKHEIDCSFCLCFDRHPDQTSRPNKITSGYDWNGDEYPMILSLIGLGHDLGGGHANDKYKPMLDVITEWN
tara:strand:+ start:9628 stop:10305 length:678 start_codon:yes stop_codon:yes gene_type:complete